MLTFIFFEETYECVIIAKKIIAKQNLNIANRIGN